jgi:hypothetical protein
MALLAETDVAHEVDGAGSRWAGRSTTQSCSGWASARSKSAIWPAVVDSSTFDALAGK